MQYGMDAHAASSASPAHLFPALRHGSCQGRAANLVPPLEVSVMLKQHLESTQQ